MCHARSTPSLSSSKKRKPITKKMLPHQQYNPGISERLWESHNFFFFFFVQLTDFIQILLIVLPDLCRKNFSGPGSNTRSPVELSCLFGLSSSESVLVGVFCLFVFLPNFNISKRWGQRFCRMSLDLGSSDTSLGSDYA